MSKYGDDALLKWFDRRRIKICNIDKDDVFGGKDIDDIPAPIDEDSMYGMILDSNQCLHVRDNPLLLQSVMAAYAYDIQRLKSCGGKVVGESPWIDIAADRDGRLGFSSYLNDHKLKWILCRMTSKPLQGAAKFVKNYSSYKDHPMLKWVLFRSETCKDFSPAVSSLQGAAKFAKNYSSYKDHPMLKWVLFRSETCKDFSPAVSIDESSMAIALGSDQCLHVVDNPLLSQTMLVRSDGDKQSLTASDAQVDADNQRGFSTYRHDPKIKWILSKMQSKLIKVDSEMLKDSRPSEKYSSYRNDPLLKWILLKSDNKCRIVEERHITTDTKDSAEISSYLDDPKLRWIFSKIKTKMVQGVKEISLENNNKYSSYKDHPLLKWILLRNERCKDAYRTAARYSSYGEDPLLKWFMSKDDKCKVHTSAPAAEPILQDSDFLLESKNEEAEESSAEESGEDFDSYFNDPLLKWILPRNSKCEQESTFVKVQKLVVNGFNQIDKTSSQIDLFEDKTLPGETVSVAAVIANDDVHVSQESESKQTDQNVNEKNRNVETASDIGEKLFGSSESSSWMVLRQLLNSFQESYEDTVTFRVGTADIIRDIRILKKSRPEATKGLHTATKTLKRNVISLENEILLHIQTLTRMVHGAGVLKNDDRIEEEEKCVTKYSNLLSSTVARIKRMQNEMSTLHQRITQELYEKTDLSEEYSKKEEESAQEIATLREKLLELDKKIAEKNIESDSIRQKMKEDAMIFTTRIAELEASFTKKTEDELLQAVHAEEQESKLKEKIVALETSINERSEKHLEIAKEQNKLMNKKLQELEASLKLNVEIDKPIADRIAFLEEELSLRKHQEIETTKKDKFEVTLLRSKMQAMERQLKKRQHHGSTVMLHEARVLKDKIRKLEDDLSDRAIKEEHNLLHMKNEGEMLQRVSSLEEQLKEQIESVESVRNDSDATDLKSRVEAMENRLKVQLEKMDGSKSKPIAIKPTNMVDKAKSPKMTKKQIAELLSILFPDKGESSSYTPIYRNQTKQIKFNSDHMTDFNLKNLETVNSDIDFSKWLGLIVCRIE